MVVAVIATCLVVNNAFNQLDAAKALRTTTAIVKAKEHVRFDEGNRTYIDDFGETREAPAGSEQWRIYYQIDNFDQVPEPKRTQLWKSEETRIKKFGLRFHYYSNAEKASYNKTQVGDQLKIMYRYIRDEKEIIGVRNLTHPDE